ncbi:MAG: lipoyl(octanoyl) transferase LipB [Mariprofundaceae bacterium]
MKSELPLTWLGRQLYEPMWDRLQKQAKVVADDPSQELIWCCEHDPIYTTGKRGVDNRFNDVLPAPMVHCDRGGETTFHGYGQLMFYPVLDLKKRGITARDYVHLLEQACINMLADYDIHTSRRCGLPGVWTDHGKIAAIGLRIYRGVAYHGMALNVNVDLKWFAAINPCGTGLAADRMSRMLDDIPSLELLSVAWGEHMNVLLG